MKASPNNFLAYSINSKKFAHRKAFILLLVGCSSAVPVYLSGE